MEVQIHNIPKIQCQDLNPGPFLLKPCTLPMTLSSRREHQFNWNLCLFKCQKNMPMQAELEKQKTMRYCAKCARFLKVHIEECNHLDLNRGPWTLQAFALSIDLSRQTQLHCFLLTTTSNTAPSSTAISNCPLAQCRRRDRKLKQFTCVYFLSIGNTLKKYCFSQHKCAFQSLISILITFKK